MRLTVRLYEGEDDDLIRWKNNLPRTVNISDEVKAALRSRIAGCGDNGHLSLADIRTVIEVALDKYTLAPRETETVEETTERVRDMLDKFGENIS